MINLNVDTFALSAQIWWQKSPSPPMNKSPLSKWSNGQSAPPAPGDNPLESFCLLRLGFPHRIPLHLHHERGDHGYSLLWPWCWRWWKWWQTPRPTLSAPWRAYTERPTLSGKITTVQIKIINAILASSTFSTSSKSIIFAIEVKLSEMWRLSPSRFLQ